MAVLIRPFTPADAKAWLDVHRAAVRVIAKRDYPAVVIDAWALPITSSTIAQLQADRSVTRIVAELGGEIAGIAELAAMTGEVRACYVSPRFVRRGIGTALVAELEALAARAGIRALSAHSSLTAEPFYLHLGYAVTGRGVHVLHTGEAMACVFMRKSL